MVRVHFTYRKMELRYWWEHGKVKIARVNQLNGERSLITLGLRVLI